MQTTDTNFGSDRFPRARIPIAQVVVLFIIICGISGCAYLQPAVTYYDPTTYKNLTDVKPEVAALYETFKEDQVSKQKISALRLRLAQTYEYERGKGQKNAETVRQIQILQEMFRDDTDERLGGQKWNDAYYSDKAKNISDAFNTAIATENLKNKNEH